MTVVLRGSSMRAVTICMPLVKMKADTKKSAAPMTGDGIATSVAPAIGTTPTARQMPCRRQSPRCGWQCRWRGHSDGGAVAVQGRAAYQPAEHRGNAVGGYGAGERPEVGAHPLGIVEALRIRHVAHDAQRRGDRRHGERDHAGPIETPAQVPDIGNCRIPNPSARSQSGNVEHAERHASGRSHRHADQHARDHDERRTPRC